MKTLIFESIREIIKSVGADFGRNNQILTVTDLLVTTTFVQISSCVKHNSTD